MRILVEFDVGSIQELREVLATGRDHTLLDAKVVRFEISAGQAKPATTNTVDAIRALYKQWDATTPKIQHVWGVQEFIAWAEKQASVE